MVNRKVEEPAEKMKPTDYKYDYIQVVCTPLEKQGLLAKAKEYGFEASLSNFLKFCALNARIDIQIGKYPLIANLMLLKELYKEFFIDSEEYEKIKSDILNDFDSKTLMKAERKRYK